MPPLHIDAAPPALVVPPMLLKRVLFLRFFLIFAALSAPLFFASHVEVAECSAGNNRRLSGEPPPAAGEWFEAAEKFGGTAVAAKVFDLMSKVVGEVGSEVKNTVLYGVSKLRTSEKFKKAKYLLSAPDVCTDLVNSRLRKWGQEGLRFLSVYSCMTPEARTALLKVASEEIPQVVRFRRKYVHLGEFPDVDSCYKSVLAVWSMLEGAIEKVRLQTKMHGHRMTSPYGNVGAANSFLSSPAAGLLGPREGDHNKHAGGTEVEGATDADTRRLAQLLQLAIKQLPRIHFYYILPFSNTSTLGNELALYLRKMLPAVKNVFVRAWRLNSVLPASSALANKRMMVDYLNDVLDFEEGLRTAYEMRRGQPCDYNPENDYHYIPPPPAEVLQAPSLTDAI